MPAPISSRRTAHAMVAQFLRLHGYTQTLATFREEADGEMEHLPSEGQYLPLEQLLDETELVRGIGAMSLQQTQDQALFSPETRSAPVPSKPLRTFDLPSALIAARTHSLPEPCMIVSGVDRSLQFISLEDGLALTDAPVNPHDAVVLAMDTHPTHPEWLLTSAMDGTMRITNVTTDTTIAAFRDHTKYVVQAAFIGDRWACTASYDGQVAVYVLEEGAWGLAGKLRLPGPVEGMCGNPGTDQVYVSVRSCNNLYIYSMSEAVEAMKKGEDPAFRKLNLNPNGDDWCSFTATHLSISDTTPPYLAVGTDSSLGLLSVYTLEGRHVHSWWATDVGDLSRGRCVWAGHRIVSAPGDASLHFWDASVSTGSAVETLQHDGNVRNVFYDKAKGWVVSCGFDKTVRVWSA